MKKTLLCMLAGLVLALCLSGCASPSTPTKTVERFTEAVDRLDVEEMLACCDASTNGTVQIAFGIADGVMSGLGFDLGVGSMDLVEALAPSLYDINSAVTGEETDMSVHARDLHETIQDNSHATVTGIWEVEVVSGGAANSDEGEVLFNLVKEGDEWKIDFSDELASAFAGSLQ